MNDALKSKLSLLPSESGCYLFKDEHQNIIYVGKAKNITKRVHQYFQRPHEGKTQKLVSEIDDLDIIVTLNEKEALLLEIDLIKKHRPTYNILFMDDKSYPMIKITHEKFPKVLVVRDRKKDKKAKYFGPYPDAKAAREVHRLIHELFPIRKCTKLPNKVCLYYHIKQCDGPCEGFIDQQAYQTHIANIIALLKGQAQHVVSDYQKKMEAAVAALDYELAATYRDKISAIHYISEKQSGVHMSQNQDMVNFTIDHGMVSLLHFVIKEGKLFEKTATVFSIIDDPIEEITSAIIHFYSEQPKPKQLYVPESLDASLLAQILNIEVSVPQRGFKKELLASIAQNAQTHLTLFLQPSVDNVETDKGLEHLEHLLQRGPIQQIEMFDVSHISGTFSVGAMVVYKENRFDKNQYRKYKLHHENDDVASLSEMVYRRAVRSLKEKQPMSDVLVVDGGISQVNAISKVLQSLQITTPLIGLSKDAHHKTSLLVLEDGSSIRLLVDDPLYQLLYKIQEEVHRFAINYHRQLRSKAQTSSLLDEIEGVGPTRKKQLLKHFGSFKAIKEATLKQLCDVLPQQVALNVIQFFHEKNKDNDL